MRWGISGTGGIAAAMVEAVSQVGSDVVAIGSRSPRRAAAFVSTHGLEAVAGTVDDLVAASPDVVYVASANHMHVPDAIACLEAGIPVLCEKPLAADSGGARSIVEAARRTDTFLMEAMWMRFLPAWSRLEELISAGVIGRLRTIKADFGVLANPDPGRRWFDPAQAGGSLLDVGIYPVTLAYLLAGAPTQISGVSTLAASGVDAQFGIAMRHPDDVVSILGSSFVSDTDLSATVSGSEGRIVLTAPFHHTSRLEHWISGERVEIFDTSYDGSGYAFEVAEVERCLTEGLLESPLHPLDDTLAVMEILDRLRR